MTPNMKRGLRIGIIVVVAIAILGVAVPYAPVDFLKAPLERALERGLGRKVEVDAVSLTLFSGPGVSLDGVTIYDDPRAGIEPFAYANTLAFGGRYKSEPVTFKQGEWYLGMDLTDPWEWGTGPRGHLKAIDPMTGKAKWEAPSDIPRFSGVLSTAGGVVFSGQLTGEFEAFDADTGKKLWQFQTGSGIEGQPVTFLPSRASLATSVSIGRPVFRSTPVAQLTFT